jgi:hypothetical protein
MANAASPAERVGLEPLRRGVAGLALIGFGLISVWTLWDEGVESLPACDGFLIFSWGPVTFFAVASWLAPLGAERFRDTRRNEIDQVPPADIAFILAIPGGACWYMLRTVTALGGFRSGRRAETGLWALWALCCAAMPGELVWMAFGQGSDSLSPDFAPDLAFAGTGLIGALTMLVLIWLPVDRRPAGVRG